MRFTRFLSECRVLSSHPPLNRAPLPGFELLAGSWRFETHEELLQLGDGRREARQEAEAREEALPAPAEEALPAPAEETQRAEQRAEAPTPC